jgi:hypothetical protein
MRLSFAERDGGDEERDVDDQEGEVADDGNHLTTFSHPKSGDAKKLTCYSPGSSGERATASPSSVVASAEARR